MNHPEKAVLPAVSWEGEDSRNTLKDSYAVVRYAVDFFTDTRKFLGTDNLSVLLRELRAIIMADCVHEEQILSMYPDGFDILIMFLGRSQLDGRIEEWSRRFEKTLADFHVPASVSLSAGVSDTIDAMDSNRLMESVNQAVFARNFGQLERNPFVRYYVDEDYQMMRRQRKMETQICTVWPDQQLQVYLQPQYELDGMKIVGAEALVRWNQPEHGLIMPDEFIPLLEKNHCIIRLDFWMLEECCKILQRWKAKGYTCVPLSVNFSRVDAMEENFVQSFVSIAEKYGVSPSQLCLEWTESSFSNQNGRVIRIAEQLHAKGYQIAMDDFGSGYSSLNILTDIPVDIVKWDKKFLDFQEHNQQRRFLLSQMMRISKNLKYKIIAEGVEYQWQAKMLKKIGCKYVQGFLFSKPIPWQACERAIQEENTYNLKEN